MIEKFLVISSRTRLPVASPGAAVNVNKHLFAIDLLAFGSKELRFNLDEICC